MLEFLKSDWFAVLSLFVGLFASWVFFRLSKGDVTSAKYERGKHAREELQDAIESYIINKQDVSEATIRNHIDAMQRKYDVKLDPFYTPKTVLQDVALRLQNSSHLDKDQKTEYASQIEAIIASLTDSQREFVSTSNTILDLVQAIETAIENEQKDTAFKLVQDLKSRLLKSRIAHNSNGDAAANFVQLIGALFAGVVTVAFTIFALMDFGFANEVYLQIIASVLFGVLAYNVVVIARRIIKRSQNSEKKN